MGSGDLDAIVLAGGGSRRLGEDKALIDVGGRTLLQRAVAATAACSRVIAVGPFRPNVAVTHWVEEDPPGAGPVHALAAGLDRVEAPYVLVLACDLPFVTATTVARLLDAAQIADGAVVTDGDSANPLCAVYRTAALAAALARLYDSRGASMRSVLRELHVVPVPDPAAALDCDTRADIDAARRRITR